MRCCRVFFVLSLVAGERQRAYSSHMAACDNLFIDVGANVGDSLVRWYNEPNCYEACPAKGQSQCIPTDVTTGQIKWPGNCTFCQMQAKYKQCAWEFPWWLASSHRRTFCAQAFEPNPLLSRKLHHQATALRRQGVAPHISVHNGTAMSVTDGTATFGIDSEFTTGSSLILDKKVMGSDGRPGRGAAVGRQRATVRTIDAVRYLRSLKAKTIALKIDVEGSEFELLRDLIASGVLCERVDHLWVEWHGNGRIDYKKLGLPDKEGDLADMYRWMFRSMQGRFVTTPERRSPHCRTILMQWA